MKLNEQREALTKNRASAIARMETVFGAAEKESRTFTDQEQKEFDDAKGDVAGVDRQLANIDDLIAAQGAKATPIKADPANPAGPIVLQRNLPKGTAFTRYVGAIALAKGNLHQALEFSKRWRDSTPEVEIVLKAAVAAGTTTDPAWAKPLVEYTNMASEFIELLRPQTFIGRMTGFRIVPFNIRVPRQTGGSTVGWVGEGLSKPVSKLAFDAVTFPWAKVAGIVVITEELARFSSPSCRSPGAPGLDRHHRAISRQVVRVVERGGAGRFAPRDFRGGDADRADRGVGCRGHHRCAGRCCGRDDAGGCADAKPLLAHA